ncbi:MAG: hypothetical protein IID37_05850, partial [Planctomycetes bacterium]|nr:hypothetical protein [Planctomycetota bacterium]
VLAVGAVFTGYAGVHMQGGGFLGIFGIEGSFQHFLEPVFASTFAAAHQTAEMHGHWETYGLMYISSAIAFVGLWVAWQLYVKRPWLAPLTRSAAGGVYDVLSHKYYVDELYDAAIVRPLRRLGDFCFAVDSYFIDTLVWMVTAIPRGLGFILRGMHGGSLQGYGVSMGAGLAIILIWMLLS